MKRLLQAFGLAVLCTACGGNGEEQEPPSLSVDPGFLIMTPGDPPYTFSAHIIEGGPADTANEVHWTLTGRGTLGATAGATTTYTPPDQAPPGETATLTARWHDQVRDVVITLSPPPIHVSGQVVDSSGNPIAGALVEINPYSRPPYARGESTADAFGNFKLGQLRIPYDLIVIIFTPATPGATFGVFNGLLRADPKLVILRRTEVEAAAARATPVSAGLPATQLEPAPGTTDLIYGNGYPHLRWTALPGGLTVVALAGPPGSSFVSIVSAGTTSGFPDEFSTTFSLSYPLWPNGETWTWRVFGIGGASTVDAFTGFPTDAGTPVTVSDPWTFTFRRYQF